MTAAPGTWPFVGRDQVLEQLLADIADPTVKAIVITAPAGAGKTRLAREATGRAEVPPVWWQASRAAAEVPLGVLVEHDVVDGTAAIDHYRRLVERATAAGGVVVVDDAPHLDTRSADLLRRLVDAGSTTVVATARDGEPVPDALEWLWLGDQTRHLALDPLDGPATGALVDAVLPHVDAETRAGVADALGKRTGGNALFLRELLADLRKRVDAGDPVASDHEAPPHLLRVLEARQQSTGPAVLDVLRDVAVAGSLPAAVLDRRHGHEAIATAERAAYVTVAAEDGRATARPAHPLHAEAAIASMTATELVRRVAVVATAVLAEPSAMIGERLAATTALLDAGEEVAIEHVVHAARVAFAALDHDLAVRLARCAIEAGDPFEAKVVLGAALSGANRPEEAEAALRAALASAATDGERARAAGRISVHLVAHGARIDEAAALLDEVAAGLEDPGARSFLDADRAKLASIRGDLSALAVEVDDGADDLSVLNASIVGAYAKAMAGDAPGARATIAAALPLAEAHRTVLPWSAELVRFSSPFAELVAEGPAPAVEEASRSLAAARADALATVGTWQFLVGFTAAIAGQLDRAAGALAAADADLEGHDLIGARPLAISAAAWVAAQAGDPATARAHLDRTMVAAEADGRVRAQVAVADAWCDVHERGAMTTGATAKALDAANEAAEGAQVVTAAIVLHELVRLGAPDAAVAPLDRLARRAPASWLLEVVSTRARLQAAGDRNGLARLARRCHDRWPLVAAEVEHVIAGLASAAGDEVAAARAALTSLRHATQLGGTLPSTLGSVRSPLTGRELEVVQAVVAGASNREAADRAGVSVRTVENQLLAAYRKLGVRNRRELAALFLT